jgi:pimeloyl-ACP methyl ester carboxylesterase
MQPFYFGSSQKQLFGVYHPPDAATARRPSAVLLCYPLGHEYLRAHRAFRNLAVALAGQGFHVLRFDYFGSGDSGGMGEDTTVDQCLADIGTAIDELKDMSGRSLVSLIGLRFGATLATLAGASRADVDRVVLWDPVLDGKVYVETLAAVHRAWRADRLGDPGAQDAALSELLGYPMTEPGIRRLCETRLLPLELHSVRSVSLLISRDEPPYAEFREALQAAQIPGTHQVIPGAGQWGRGDLVHHILLPHKMLNAIGTVMCS